MMLTKAALGFEQLVSLGPGGLFCKVLTMGYFGC